MTYCESNQGFGIDYVASYYDGTRYHYRPLVAMDDASAVPTIEMRACHLGVIVSVRRKDTGDVVWRNRHFLEGDYENY